MSLENGVSSCNEIQKHSTVDITKTNMRLGVTIFDSNDPRFSLGGHAFKLTIDYGLLNDALLFGKTAVLGIKSEFCI